MRDLLLLSRAHNAGSSFLESICFPEYRRTQGGVNSKLHARWIAETSLSGLYLWQY